jgi:4'-phosphopantetheinyl transferase
VAALGTLPAQVKQQAFFACWTRKEAYIKAVGKGLTLPLDQFDVSLRPGEPAALLRTLWDPHEASRWSLRELHPGPSFAGALCAEGHCWGLKCWQWPGV